MDDPLTVRGVESIRDLDGDLEQLFQLDRTALDAMLQRHAVQKLHGDEGPAFVFANVMNRTDIGMIQC